MSAKTNTSKQGEQVTNKDDLTINKADFILVN